MRYFKQFLFRRSRSNLGRVALCTIGLGLLAAAFSNRLDHLFAFPLPQKKVQTPAQSEKPTQVRPIPTELPDEDSAVGLMTAKLSLSKDLFEGIVLADFAAIDATSQKLRRLSQQAVWSEVSQDPVYNHFTIEFQRITQRISENARSENLDGAAYSLQLLTATCIACHQDVRDVKSLKSTPASP